MMRTLPVLILALLSIAACAEIERYQKAAQPSGQLLTAGIGDTVLRIEKSRDLENLFGRADLYGRETNEGFSELIYLGKSQGDILFARYDVEIDSNETTMSRTGVGTLLSSSNIGDTSTTTTAVYTAPPTSSRAILPRGFIEFSIPGTERQVYFAGHVVLIMEAAPTFLKYEIAVQPPR